MYFGVGSARFAVGYNSETHMECLKEMHNLISHLTNGFFSRLCRVALIHIESLATLSPSKKDFQPLTHIRCYPTKARTRWCSTYTEMPVLISGGGKPECTMCRRTKKGRGKGEKARSCRAGLSIS